MTLKNYLALIQYNILCFGEWEMRHAKLKQFIPGVYERKATIDGKSIIAILRITLESRTAHAYGVTYSSLTKEKDWSDEEEEIDQWTAIYADQWSGIVDTSFKKICLFLPEKRQLIINEKVFTKREE